MWLFSRRAVAVLLAKCGWNDATQSFAGGAVAPYDLYDRFGTALGRRPANPDPEISPAEVAAALAGRRYVMVTGRSDYPNQINNVLGFPYLFRGALDVRATTIDKGMKVAAAHALAELARQPVPDEVKAIYPGERLEFGDGYIIPKPFDRRLFVEIPAAVAAAAAASGVARAPKDPAAYRAELERRNAERG